MSTICVTSPTLTSVQVSSSPTVVTTTSDVVISQDGHTSIITYTTCVPNLIVKRQENCTPSVQTSTTFIPGVTVTRQVPVLITLTQFQTFSTTLFGTSCSVSPLLVSPSPSPSPSPLLSPSLSSPSPSSSLPSSPIPNASNSQPVSQSSPTPSLASSVYVVPVPISTSGSSTIYSYSTYVSYFSTDTADGAQATDTGISDSPLQGPPVNKMKVVGSVCGSILGAVLLGFGGYFLFKKMANSHKYKSGKAEDKKHLRESDDEPHDQGQSICSGSEPHYDQPLGTSHLHGMQGQGSPFTHDGVNGSQGQGGSYTSDTSMQSQGGSYGQSYGQDVGQHTQNHWPDTQGMQAQGTNYTNVQGQETAYVQQTGTGVEQYNTYGGHFPPGYDPFQAAQNAQQAINGHPVGADGIQHYAAQPVGYQNQNPFLDASGGVQDQMSQVAFGAPPTSVPAGSSVAVGGASVGLLLPTAAAAQRGVSRSRNYADPYVSLRSPKYQHPL